MKGKIGIFKMKHFFAGIGEIKLAFYILYVLLGLAPLFHTYIINAETGVGKSVLTIIGVVSVFMLTIARIYRRFFYNKNKLD
ncbi:hypothetical protein HMPREF3228_00653 [Streptococcus mitis]|jgi:hypothetical protein|uniref:Bacteriocin n=3 Tax=Streptococcus TaxID=1301 RepID=A0A133S0J5_STRMT|nr:hypothetical protein HMPREF3228_00653 [Streptococcus mitis]MDU2912807.1 hypothetical protein [Staphylococcus warneri]